MRLAAYKNLRLSRLHMKSKIRYLTPLLNMKIYQEMKSKMQTTSHQEKQKKKVRCDWFQRWSSVKVIYYGVFKHKTWISGICNSIMVSYCASICKGIHVVRQYIDWFDIFSHQTLCCKKWHGKFNFFYYSNIIISFKR